MPRFRFSMRLTLGATIVLMGLIGLALALAAGEIYHRQALEHQRLALRSLVERGTVEELDGIETRARELGQAILADSAFARARVSDRSELAFALYQATARFAARGARLALQQVTLYDSDLKPRAAATPAAPVPATRLPVCPPLLARAHQSAARGDNDGFAALCVRRGQVQFAVLVPYTDGVRGGWLEVVADPLPAITRVESRLGLPVRIRDGAGLRLFASTGWPPPDAMHNTLVAEHVLTGAGADPVLQVAALRDIAPLRQRLREDRLLVMTISLAVTLFSMLFAGWILERTALRPLKVLTEHLRRVTGDKTHLGQTVAVGGIAEIRELADDFNHMARELSRLYGSLEHLAFTDPLTNLPNRARFRDSLDEAARRHAQAQTPFTLFLMDLDRFKGVNDTLGHQIGDLLLQEVSLRLKSVLRGSDTIARLDNETIQELDNKMVARLGGDEFAAILPRVGSLDDASGIARKLLVVMQEPFVIREHRLTIGISIGIAVYPQHGEDIDTLIQRADAAMYNAKNNQTGLAFPDTMHQTPLI